jgi:DNA-binding NarL/FixJ family response regulator
MNVKLILVDDHKVIRQSLSLLLSFVEGIEIVGQAENGIEAVKLTELLQPDLVLMDIKMPELDGVEAARAIRKKNKDVKIVFLTMMEDEKYIYNALDVDINGYLLKTMDGEVFIDAVKEIIHGGRFYDSSLNKILDNKCQEKEEQQEYLTEREKEIIKYVAHGQTSGQIAEKLFISVFTVQKHRKNVMKKLGIKGIAELVKYAIEKEIIK